jgi:2-oxoglutarate ferredoxin oxidoreductase subunit alpha
MQTARNILPNDVLDYDEHIRVGLISFGSNHPAVEEARDWLRAANVETNYLRVRAVPLSDDVSAFIANHDRVYVLENNFDGQLAQIIRMEHAEDVSHVTSLALGDGLPMTARWIFNNVMESETPNRPSSGNEE